MTRKYISKKRLIEEATEREHVVNTENACESILTGAYDVGMHNMWETRPHMKKNAPPIFDGWIPLKDGLPSIEVSAIVCDYTEKVLITDGEEVAVGYATINKYTKKVTWFPLYGSYDLSVTVTHWMSLPNVPRKLNS